MASKTRHTTRSTRRGGGRPGVARQSATAATVTRRVRATDWISAARPATLGLAIAPVILGWGVAALHFLLAGIDPWDWSVLIITVLALKLALVLQIGVNFANDYSDGIRGTDAHRSGPARLTASGAVAPRRVLAVAIAFFLIAAALGVALIVLTEQWWLTAVGVAALAAAWFYTGGRRPYGYAGFGEVVVFVFFGMVATTGTAYLLTNAFSTEAILAGVAMGCFAAAVLHINNVRDRDTDLVASKRTLATRLPRVVNRIVYTILVAAPYGILVAYLVLLGTTGFAFFALCFTAPAILIAWTATTAKEYVLVLKLTVWSSLAYALLVAWSFAF